MAYAFTGVDTTGTIFTDGAPYLGEAKITSSKGNKKGQRQGVADEMAHNRCLIMQLKNCAVKNKRIPVNVVGVGVFDNFALLCS